MSSSSTPTKTAIVIGSGLGGLLSACVLAKHGFRVTVLEKLAFPGGKFTQFDHHGFQVPSGAFHCLPGGIHGNLYRILDNLGIPPRVIESECSFIVRIDDRRYISTWDIRKKDGCWTLLSVREKIKALGMAAKAALGFTFPDISVADYIGYSGTPTSLSALLDKFMTFSSGVGIRDASIVDLTKSSVNQKGSHEGLIAGGCKTVIDSLLQLLQSLGGDIRLQAEAESIDVSGGRVCGVMLADGESLPADLIVSNAGPMAAVSLLGDNCPEWLKLKSDCNIQADGAAYSVWSDQPLVPMRTVEFPLHCRYIGGYVEVSKFDPSLCPEGKHYLIAYQSLDSSESVEMQIDGGVSELLELFPGIIRDDIFNIALYYGEYPAARTQQRLGQHGNGRFPIKVDGIEGLYMISHDSCGYGFAAEVIGDAASQFERMISR